MEPNETFSGVVERDFSWTARNFQPSSPPSRFGIIVALCVAHAWRRSLGRLLPFQQGFSTMKRILVFAFAIGLGLLAISDSADAGHRRHHRRGRGGCGGCGGDYAPAYYDKGYSSPVQNDKGYSSPVQKEGYSPVQNGKGGYSSPSDRGPAAPPPPPPAPTGT